jgi:hypothetical protein
MVVLARGAEQLRPSALPPAERYVRYFDAIEVVQAGEAELIDKIVASMARVNRGVCDKHRHATRDAHAKSHGVLVGTLSVHEDLPAHLRQGMFALPATYPVVVRWSSAPGELYDDSIPSPKGMAIKVIGVPGPKILPAHENELTQDFLLVNHPLLQTGDVAAYWKAQQVRERHAGLSEVTLRALALLARGVTGLLNLAGADSDWLANRALANHHILGQTFHSMAAPRFGDYVAKISAAPHSASVRALRDVAYDPAYAPSVLRDQIVEFFRAQGAEYELRAQLCTDLARMPVEDASVRWPELDSPQQPLAILRFAPQGAYSAARRVYADDVLSFNPWHCIAEHRPLGSIMRARLRSYEASSRFRHEANQQPRREPRDIDEVPP